MKLYPETTHPTPLTYSQRLDALDFDEKCDGSLPLEEMINPDPSIRKLFQDIDRSKARVWALTNAYKTVCMMEWWRFLILHPLHSFQHAMRVLKILNVDDLIDGLVFCDYSDRNFSCKPEQGYYDQVRLSRAIPRLSILTIA